MKKLVLSMLFALSSQSAFAMQGPFFTVQLGYSELRTPNKNIFGDATALPGTRTITESSSHTRGGPGETVGFGYQFNDHWSMVGELSHVASSYYDKKQCAVTKDKTCQAVANAEYFVDSNSLKFLGQFHQHVFGHTTAHVDAGLAIVTQNVVFSNKATKPDFRIPSTMGGQKDNRIYDVRPTVGFGIYSEFHNKYELGLQWSRVFGRGHPTSSEYQPDQNSVGVELKVYFGCK